jgi:hypothetical protein
MIARILREGPIFHANRTARPASRPARPGTAYTSHHHPQPPPRHQHDRDRPASGGLSSGPPRRRPTVNPSGPRDGSRSRRRSRPDGPTGRLPRRDDSPQKGRRRPDPGPPCSHGPLLPADAPPVPAQESSRHDHGQFRVIFARFWPRSWNPAPQPTHHQKDHGAGDPALPDAPDPLHSPGIVPDPQSSLSRLCAVRRETWGHRGRWDHPRPSPPMDLSNPGMRPQASVNPRRA